MVTAIGRTIWLPSPYWGDGSGEYAIFPTVEPAMGDLSPYSDADLVRECLSGSEYAWDEFYRRFLGTVKTVIRRRLGVSIQESEDVAQSVFAELIPALKSYDPTHPLKRFVCTVAERTCIAEYRKATSAKRDAPTDPLDHHGSGEPGMANPVARTPSPEESVSHGQLTAILREGLKSLGEQCRQVLRLRYLQDLSFKEISEMIGGTEGALFIRAKRCLNDLRALYLLRVKGGSRR